MIKVIVAGSRNFDNYDLLKENLLYYLQRYDLTTVEIVSGTARGADSLGERFAMEYGCKIKRFPADWNKYGKKAGYIRNRQMAEYADACVCFWDGKSKGTKWMIELAKQKGLNLRIVLFDDKE